MSKYMDTFDDDAHYYKIFGSKKIRLPKRFVITGLAFLGIVWFFGVRVNLGVAIVAMVGRRNHSYIKGCPNRPILNTTNSQIGEFDWSLELQGILLGSFYYGYIFTQILGGLLAERFGGKLVFGAGMLVTSGLSLLEIPHILTPLAARTSVFALITLRVLEGVTGGLILVAAPVIMRKWTPVHERTRHQSLLISGSMMGPLVCQPITGILSDSDFLGGWPASFYVIGLGGMLTGSLWLIIVKESPEQQSALKAKIKDYIKHVVSKKRPSPPWRKIICSPPFWAFCFAHTSITWVMYSMMAFLPTYVTQVLHLNITQNSTVSSLPYAAGWCVINLGALFSDFVIKHKWFSVITVRKAITGFGHFTMGGFLVAASYTGCNTLVNIICLVFSVGLGGLVFTGTFVNPLDIAPIYAGTLFGLANTLGTVPGFLGPMVTGFILGDQPSLERWQTVLFIMAGISFFGGAAFVLFGSAEKQTWAEGSKKITKKHGIENVGFSKTIVSDGEKVPEVFTTRL